MQKAVFLDRDGTINRDTGYIKSTAETELLEGVGEALRRLKEKGFLLIIVTNQSGIARGYYDENDLAKVNEYILDKLKADGAVVDDIFYCPHHPDAVSEKYRLDCDCRKPKPGLILQAIEKYGIDPGKSFIIGDSRRDVEAGNRAGVRGLLIADKAESEDRASLPNSGPESGGAGTASNLDGPIYTGSSLSNCADWLISFLKEGT